MCAFLYFTNYPLLHSKCPSLTVFGSRGGEEVDTDSMKFVQVVWQSYLVQQQGKDAHWRAGVLTVLT